jgi:hypothetical protein
MTLNPRVWQPIAIALTALNLAGVGFAAARGEAWHAAIHAALALAFGLWAQRLRQTPDETSQPARLEALEADVGSLRGELGELQERLDFAERVLAQPPDLRRADPHRP